MAYELYYWPDIPGRGEFVRLVLEAAGVGYRDVARAAPPEQRFNVVLEVLEVLEPGGSTTPPFAPPVLYAGDRVIAQTPLIMRFLGERHGLAPDDEAGRLWADQCQLTIADWLVEAHDTHHPLGPSLYYEEQKAEAARRSALFRDERLPKFLVYFEGVLRRNPHGPEYAVGAHLSHVDLSLFQMLQGLRYAFPQAMQRREPDCPCLCALHERVGALPAIVDYLASRRRPPFTEEGIFRHYPELDG